VTGLKLLLHQYRYDQKTFWREPAAVFFTVALPLIFLFLFVSIFGNQPVDLGDHTVKGATYYIPGIITLALLSASTVNLAISLTTLRERGVLKRVRGTPLPPWVFMAGRIMTASAVAVFLVVVVTLIGRLVYGVELPGRTLPGVALTVLVGTASMCCLGFAMTAIIPSENAAPAVTNAIVLPLYFISGIFIPTDQIPEAMQTVAGVFPVKHVFDAMLYAFDPSSPGPGIRGGDLLVLAAWGVVGLVVATRTFRWTARNA